MVRRAKGRWEVRDGPIPRSVLARAGERDWTLLVNGVDHHLAAAARLLRRFAFVSEARLDDVMVSYAAPGGGVGPHVDSYDVFLIQARGRRLWRLARARPFRLVPGAPLKLIADFRAEEELVLEPGDLLYLPPGWGHDGIALEECVTCSVGMRAPQGDELPAAFLDYLQERGLPAAGYRDPGLSPARHPGRIGRGMLEHAARQLGRIRWSRRDVEDFLGRHLSSPRPHTVFASRRMPAPGRLARSTVVLDSKTRMLYGGGRVFLNGESWAPGPAALRPLAALADRRSAPGSALARAGLRRLIYDWYCAGALDLRRREGADHE
jgi:50S ribosomal protein L16 3-hydroxylase